jgi:tetratricopeptide (TPR) repeat protein
MEHEKSSERSVTTTFLPWIVAGAGFLVYLLTLNKWVTASSIVHVAKVSGWTWQPELTGPLYWLVTLPFHFLPDKQIPLILNIFTALCACLTLALLARSVSILPHDRTEDQRIRERSPSAVLTLRAAWIPPVVAALVCGLQMTFWENATVASGEMLDLLLFAYVIRNLLEFRLDGRESWLLKASLVYGAAMTNNWAMIGFFPLFLVALIWIRGLGFFSARFLTRMFLLGLVGLSLYLLLPLIVAFSGETQTSFWQALRFNLGFEKSCLLALPFNKDALFRGDPPMWVLALPALLPMLLLGIRWPSYFGDPSKLGVATATLVFHVFHAVLLTVCLWVAMDPPFSPRKLLPSLPLLTFYYLGALAVGYYVGYFLLVFGSKPHGRPRPVPAFMPFVNSVVLVGLLILIVAAPAALIYRNLPQIRAGNGSQMRDYAQLLIQQLPNKSAVLISDDGGLLLAIKSWLNQGGRDPDYVFVDTGALLWPDYHAFQKRTYGKHWTVDLPKKRKGTLEHTDAIQTLFTLSESNQVYYLHPSFGYYFEFFYPEPHGMSYRLVKYPTNAIWMPPLSDELIATNEAFWDRANKLALQPLRNALSPSTEGLNFGDKLLQKFHLKRERNAHAMRLAPIYSRALNYWGVDLQKNGRLTNAAVRFQQALDLNPENIVADINLKCNRNLQSGITNVIGFGAGFEDAFGRLRDWEPVMNVNGPFDEPNALLRQAGIFIGGRNFRQAAICLKRTTELAPESFDIRLIFAGTLIQFQRPDEALEALHSLQKDSAQTPFGKTNAVALTMTEAAAYLARRSIPEAAAAFSQVLEKQPDDEAILNTVVSTYMNFGVYSNALPHVEKLISLSPSNLTNVVNKGFILLQLSNYVNAVESFTQAINLQPTNHVARFNRAVAYLLDKKYDLARKDYQQLLKDYPTAYEVHYGLGEVAYNQKDRISAVRHYQLYLSTAPTNSVEARTVADRLKELQGNLQ